MLRARGGMVWMNFQLSRVRRQESCRINKKGFDDIWVLLNTKKSRNSKNLSASALSTWELVRRLSNAGVERQWTVVGLPNKFCRFEGIFGILDDGNEGIHRKYGVFLSMQPKMGRAEDQGGVFADCPSLANASERSTSQGLSEEITHWLVRCTGAVWEWPFAPRDP